MRNKTLLQMTRKPGLRRVMRKINVCIRGIDSATATDDLDSDEEMTIPKVNKGKEKEHTPDEDEYAAEEDEDEEMWDIQATEENDNEEGYSATKEDEEMTDSADIKEESEEEDVFPGNEIFDRHDPNPVYHYDIVSCLFFSASLPSLCVLLAEPWNIHLSWP